MTPTLLALARTGLAALPIAVVLYLMLGRRWGGSQAGLAGWATAVLVAVAVFGAGPQLLVVAFGRALLLALFVLYIIWMALLLYHVVNEAGAIAIIGRELPPLAGDAAGQAVLLAWVLGSFLQGATGFGVPAAVIAPLLVGLGFAANTAVAMALVGHAWAVTFGSLGSSFLALMAATGLPGEALAGPAAALLAVACLACGAAVLWLAGRGPALRARAGQLLLLTAVMGGAQWGLARAGLWTIAAFGAGLAGLAAATAVAVRSRRRPAPTVGAAPPIDAAALARALAPYLLLVLVVLVGQLVLDGPLNRLQLTFDFPAVRTRQGWATPAGPGRAISLFGHGGALLLYTSLLAFVWFRARGPLTVERAAYDGRRIATLTLRGSRKSTISIVALVAMAVTMQHAGMTQRLADLLSGAGAAFPFLSVFLGALGAFMTGSNTNSNVVFGLLQAETATALGLAIPVILAGQTAGGAIGSLFAPAKVVVGCSTVEGAEEGVVLRLATAYGVAILLALALLVHLAA